MSGVSKQANQNDLSLSDKIIVIEELGRKASQSSVATKFGISQSQVSHIWKAKEKLFAAQSNANPSRKRARKSTHKDVGEASLQWFKEVKRRGLIISGPMLREKANDLSKIMGVDFDPSLSWVHRWQERNGIIFKRQHGEKHSHDTEAAEYWIASVWPRIQEQYSASDVYNCEKTGLYFRALPEGTMCFKDEKPSGSKKSKERLTVLLAANMDGSDKRKLLVVGKAAKPRCFRGISTLPILYRSNSNSWMTATLFHEWLGCFYVSM